MAGPERDSERFTPELDFVVTMETKVQQVLFENHLGALTDAAYPGSSMAANAHPVMLDAYADELEMKAMGARQALERNGYGNDPNLNSKRLDQATNKRFLEESREGIEAAREVLYSVRESAALLGHSTVFPRAKAAPGLYAEDLQNARLPFHLRESVDGQMLLAETADAVAKVQVGKLATPKSVAQKSILPILDRSIREADKRIASLATGADRARLTLALMDHGQKLKVQEFEHQTVADNARKAASQVREVWTDAMHHEANMPADLRSGGLNVPHPSTFADVNALDTYIAEVAEAAKEDVLININMHLQPAKGRSAEGPGLV